MENYAEFKVTVKGASSHGSAPHLGKDAVMAASSIVLNLQTYASRVNNPLKPFTLCVGKARGGLRFNIVAGDATLEGCVCSFANELREDTEEELKQIVRNTAAALGCSAEVAVTRSYREDAAAQKGAQVTWEVC